MMRVRNLGRKSLEEVLDKLRQLGLSLKEQDNSYYFISLYPDYIQKIAREKGDYWEYRLFIEVAIYRYERLQEYRNQKAAFWEYKNCLNRIENTNEFVEFIEEQAYKLDDFLYKMAVCMNEELNEALGEQGESGDEHKIIEATENMMQIYKDMISWKLSFGDIDADYMYRSVIEQFCLLIESVLDNIDVLYSKLLEAKKQIEVCLAGMLEEEQLHIDLSMTFKAKTDGFAKECDAWVKKYYDESC